MRGGSCFRAFKAAHWLYLHNFTRLHHREFYDLKMRLALISQEPDKCQTIKGREEKRPAERLSSGPRGGQFALQEGPRPQL